MQPLDKTLRNKLERTIVKARDVAEAAAGASLEQLGVGTPKPYAHLSPADRELRRKLRAHGRQLGDRRDPATDTQSVDRLIEEVAYEHWHRMLFARFLAENNLLMYPDPVAVPVTLEECEDLAADEGAANGWELAARYAARMLPQIFRNDSPSFQLVLPPEHQHELEQLIAGLPVEVFTALDAIGWVYQFWQTKRKNEVNASEVKVGARELPAVTQLFTEPYMVSFLLDNSLGGWWVVQRLTDEDFRAAKTEDELREKASLPGMPLEYLRFVQDDNGYWSPAAGTFDAWPEDLSALRVMDPCCGSGHFLVAAFLMLVPMRMETEVLSASEACYRVLKENLHGLEIDKRCVELAAFALALAAWKYPNAGGYRDLPELNVACSGLAVSASKEQWLSVAVRAADMIQQEKEQTLFEDPARESLWHTQLKAGMEALYDLFSEAPTLGSLIDPGAIDGDFYRADYNKVAAILQETLEEEQSEEQQEAAVVAHGLAKAAQLLAGKYHLITTNVPYLSRGKHAEALRRFCETHHKEAKNDLATAFLERCLAFCVEGGTASVVLPQNWLFLTSYRKFREKLLKNDTWHMIARLGPGAFETISGEVVKAILLAISRGNVAGASSSGSRKQKDPEQDAPAALIRGLDVSEPRTAAEKTARLLTDEVKTVAQAKQLENPDARVVFASGEHDAFLSDRCTCIEGISTGDIPRFVMFFWDINAQSKDWAPFIQNVTSTSFYGGRSDFIRWEGGNGALHKSPTAHNFPSEKMNGYNVLENRGIRITQMGKLPVTLYGGEVFGKNGGTLVLDDNTLLSPVWAFYESDDYAELVREIDQSMAVTVGSMIKVPFDLEHWTKVAEEKYPHGLPEPYSDGATQWLFHGHPCGSVIWDEARKWTAHGQLRTDETVLQVAVARLLGYRWPAEHDPDMELADEQREWVNRCKELYPYADEDGIVCIPPVRGEVSAADRLLNLLATAYGDSWSNDTLAELLKNADHGGKTLESWLRDKFFKQHCKLFHNRPFIWHIWDGLRDGFSVLVNYHKLDHKRLETLIYTYLGDWINRQKRDIENGVDGAQEKLAAAHQLKNRLELILEGEAPYDIFVRWKPIAEQPIGWNPDFNDGVRLNIRPFMTVPDVGKKGAGVLRDKPNIHWKKDRGKDVESAPWCHLFKGDRINDHHLTLETKQKAREEAK